MAGRPGERSCSSACGAEQNTSSTSVATTALTHVAIATKPSAETPTPTIVEDTGPAVLGALLGAFVTKYGTADLRIEGSPRFALYGIQNNLGLELEPTNTCFTQRVILVEAGGPNGSWDRPTATAACSTFAPGDAIDQHKTFTLVDPTGKVAGFDKIFYSATLKATFPASEFVDHDQHQTKAGLFDMSYLYTGGSTTQISGCSLDLGTQGSQY